MVAQAAAERMLSPGVICTSTGPVPAGVRAGRVAQARTGLREDLVTPGPAAPVATAEVEGRQAVAAPGVLMARQVPPRPEVRAGLRALTPTTPLPSWMGIREEPVRLTMVTRLAQEVREFPAVRAVTQQQALTSPAVAAVVVAVVVVAAVVAAAVRAGPAAAAVVVAVVVVVAVAVAVVVVVVVVALVPLLLVPLVSGTA